MTPWQLLSKSTYDVTGAEWLPLKRFGEVRRIVHIIFGVQG
jgi:hypothetical protein